MPDSEKIAKVDVEFVNGTHLIIKGKPADVGGPFIVNVNKLLQDWKYPCRLVFTINIGSDGNIKPSLELVQA